MNQPRDVIVLVGSLRKGSFTRKVARAMIELAPASLRRADAVGALGAFGANHHLRQMLVFLDMPAMLQPEAYIGGANKLFDQNDRLTVESTRDFLRQFMEAFARWIERLAN